MISDSEQMINPIVEVERQAQVNTDETYTIDMLAEAFMAMHVGPKLRRGATAIWVLRDFIRPKWGQRKPEGISKQEVTRELDRLLQKNRHRRR